ncbi:MAG TPA: preprotein translocase subunit SecE [Frankiaceae bacterium]|nr:preprotein translocase subunit SecE [Frankiaceae bacterium]
MSSDATAATFEEPAAEPTPTAGGKGVKKPPKDRRGLGRIPRLYREVAAEMRKVIWPTRRELLAYSTVVLVFVTAMVLLVAGLDFGFTKAVLAVFG